LFREGSRLLGRATQRFKFLPQLLGNDPQLFSGAAVYFVGDPEQFRVGSAGLGRIAARVRMLAG
jgi:hypothetical protein